MLPAVLISLMVPLGDSVWEKIPAAPLYQGLGNTIRVVRYQGVSDDKFSVVLPSTQSSQASGDILLEDSFPIPHSTDLVDRDAPEARPQCLQLDAQKDTFARVV